MEEEQGGTRVTVRFPDQLLIKIDEIAKRHFRSRSSVVIEACDRFVNETAVIEAEKVAEKSPEYRALVKKLREDLGLPPDSLHVPVQHDPD